MKLDAEVTITTFHGGIPVANHVTVAVDADYVTANESSIDEYVANSDELYHAFGYTPNADEFEIDNIDEILEGLMELEAPVVDTAEECDYNALKNSIKNVLRRYFEVDDDGVPNKTFDDSFTASDAIDDIHKIVGDI